ncbi:hypothetical protein LTR85_011284 [Meristemomyces frigidus]|nr:hypothetical protein LTR85_011284 [Meristemomyces frigidus]
MQQKLQDPEWYARHGEDVRQRLRHRIRRSEAISYPQTYTGDVYHPPATLEQGMPPTDLPYDKIHALCNKTAFLYALNIGPFSKCVRRVRREIWARHFPNGTRKPGRSELQKATFITEHLALYDEVEARIAAMSEQDRADKRMWWIEDGGASMLFPTCRAVVLLVQPAVSKTEEHNCALMLTGDNSRMASGAVSFQSIQSAIIRSHNGDPDIVYLPLQSAIEFLMDLEVREEHANAEMSARSWVRREAKAQGIAEKADEAVDLVRKHDAADKWKPTACHWVQEVVESIDQ